MHGAAGNSGLQFTIDIITSYFSGDPWSMADLFQYTGALAAQQMGGPSFASSVRWGRPDAPKILCRGEAQLRQPDFNGGHKR